VLFYKEIHKLGAIYAELQPPSSKRFFQVDRDGGEMFVWIGRFHFILTPWRRLTAGVAAVWGLMTAGPYSLFSFGYGCKSAAAAVLTVVAAAATEVSSAGADNTALSDQQLVHVTLYQWQDQEFSLGASVLEVQVTLLMSRERD
jgi:hypothetical protein